MPEVSRKDRIDTVASPDGSGICCPSPSTQYTEEGSTTVFVNAIGAVRIDDRMIVHPYPGPCCAPHAPPLVKASETVFVEGRGLARRGDIYDDGSGPHVLSSGSPDVFAN